jgi:hypothetical protein
MHKSIAIIVLTLGLAACGAISALVDGYKYVKAVEGGLEEATGVKPAVGFNWNNGRLVSVTVNFPYLYETKPLNELAEQVRTIVTREFKQTPDHILLGFDLTGKAPGRAAQAERASTGGD